MRKHSLENEAIEVPQPHQQQNQYRISHTRLDRNPLRNAPWPKADRRILRSISQHARGPQAVQECHDQIEQKNVSRWKQNFTPVLVAVRTEKRPAFHPGDSNSAIDFLEAWTRPFANMPTRLRTCSKIIQNLYCRFIIPDPE